MYTSRCSPQLPRVCNCSVFFFSSRRRHTRFDCDWSSDVCSSDLMDEPCSALDPAATQRIEELLVELKQSYSIVIVTHNMQQASRVSDLTGFFYLGHLIEFGDTKRSEEHTSELQSQLNLVCRLLLEKKEAAIEMMRVSPARCNLLIVPPVNPKRSEKMGLAHSPSPPCCNARHANRAGCRPIVSIQNASRSPVGKPCAPAPARRSASFCEEAEVDTPRPAPLGLAVRSVG